jgi:hypothetical protein
LALAIGGLLRGQLLGAVEVARDDRHRLGREGLERGVAAVVGIGLEHRQRLLVPADLLFGVEPVEVVARALERGEVDLLLGGQLGGDGRRRVGLGGGGLEVGGRLGVVPDHHRGEGLDARGLAHRLGKLRALDLEHVARGGGIDEALRGGRHRVGSGRPGRGDVGRHVGGDGVVVGARLLGLVARGERQHGGGDQGEGEAHGVELPWVP